MTNKNVEQFINGPVRYLRIIGFEFESTQRWMKLLLIIGLCNMNIVLLGQLLFGVLSDVELVEKTAGISYMNYFLVSVGKIIALIYNRSAILETMNNFRMMYPSEDLEMTFKLQNYRKQYLLIEQFITGFFKSVTTFYCMFPVFVSLTEFLRRGIFTYRTPLMLWYPIEIHGNWIFYFFTYVQQIVASFEVGIIILGLDLCLFSCLLQLCMHFEIVKRNILSIRPDRTGSAERILNEQIVYHQMLLRLAEKINDIFTPSVLFSLLSSSFIICFTGYQLLGEISMFIVVKAFFLLGYELKQVIITCYLADRLMENSFQIAVAIYEHNWYNGSPKYKRLVLMVLMRSQKSVGLKIAGISDVSLQTLRKVMSVSYQIFTVLKTGGSKF